MTTRVLTHLHDLNRPDTVGGRFDGPDGLSVTSDLVINLALQRLEGEIWLAGRTIGDSGEIFIHGIFSDQLLAEGCCQDRFDFVAPFWMNRSLDMNWIGRYHPKG